MPSGYAGSAEVLIPAVARVVMQNHLKRAMLHQVGEEFRHLAIGGVR